MYENTVIPGGVFEEEKKYWLTKLSGELSELNLFTDFPRGGEYERKRFKIFLPEDVVGSLRRVGKNNDLSIFVLLLASLKILLFKYTGQNEIIVSSPIYGADARGYNRNVIFRDSLYPGMLFKDVLLEVKQTVAGAYKNQYYPIDRVLNLLDQGNKLKVNRVFMQFGNIHDKELGNAAADAGNDILLSIRDIEGKLEAEIAYNAGIFKFDTIRGFMNCYSHVIDQVLSNTNIGISEVDLATEEEKREILDNFNRTDAQFPRDKTIVRLFEEQAARTPENIAIRFSRDLDDIFEELEGGETNLGLWERMAKCCFKKNPFIFEANINDSAESAGYKLLKTHRHNSIVVNRNISRVLDLFDGTRTLGAVFSFLRGLHLTLVIYSLKQQDVIELSYEFRDEPETFSTGNEKSIIDLVKSMFKHHLIELTDFNHRETEEEIRVQWDSRGEERPHVDIPLNSLLNRDKPLSGARVLFLGDTPGVQTVGLLYMASYLRRNGIKSYCQFYNTDWSPGALKNSIHGLLKEIRPGIVAVSMKWFPHIARVLEMCKIIKEFAAGELHYDIKVVVGGNTASYFARDIIQYEWVDYVIRGDGEIPLLQLARGETNISNCLYKQDGIIVENPLDYLEDTGNSGEIYLSHLDEIMLSRFAPLPGTFFLYTHKGCGMDCFYCGGANSANKKIFNRTRLFRRGVEVVRKDICEAKKYTSTFMFDFDAPNVNLVEYCRDIWKGIDLSSHFCIFTNLIPPSAELIALVNKTFKYVYWNLDVASLSERHRKQLYSLGLVKPQPTDDEILEVFNRCEAYDNAEIRINLIAGLPYFTMEDITLSDTLLSRILNRYTCCSELHWARLHAEPGAPVAADAEKYDMYSLASTFDDFLKYSRKNFSSDYNVEYYDYPYIYYEDEGFNSRISNFYSETNIKVEKYKKQKKEKRNIYDKLSYRELNDCANRLAGVLKEQGVTNNCIVGLMARDPREAALSILGILKAGGAYLPIEPDIPGGRKKYMIEDSSLKTLLLDSSFSDSDGLDFPQLSIVRLSRLYLENYNGANPGSIVNPSNLAYVIYTSGTTGAPRGVLVNHHGLLNYTCWRVESYRLTEKDVTLEPLSYGFDGFGSNFYSSLVSGGTLAMIPNSKKADYQYIKEIVRNEGVTNVSLVPGMYGVLVDIAEPEDLRSLRFVVLAGERAGKSLLDKSREKNPGILHINEYGPTETTVTAVARFPMDVDNTAVIGKPIANTRIHIVDNTSGILPVGVPGQLCIEGTGVARGYLNNPELTAEKFVDSLPGNRSGRLYKTGDVARWLPDGGIEFLGRIDFQVKIRGYRIEVEEIETQLRRCENVKDTVVAALDISAASAGTGRGDKYLCAYVVSEDPPDIPALKEFLSGKLPGYMVPSYFVHLEKLPLTSNGKVDKKQLPLPEIRTERIAPGSETEKKLVKIWAEVLGISEEEIGRDSNFFELGGHSLSANTAAAKIHKVFNVKNFLAQIFETPTVKALAEQIKEAAQEDYFSIEASEEKEYYPLSSAQKRLYILQRLEFGTTSYNTPFVVLLEGRLEKEKMEAAFRKLIERHESLRTSFEMINDEPVQRIHKNPGLSIAYSRMSEEEAKERVLQNIKPFDLTKAPLFSVNLVTVGEERYILIVDMHHIITDGTSIQVLVKEFMALYAGEPLPPLRLQYKDFARWQEKEKKIDSMRRQETFWLEQFDGDIPVLDLPVDYPRPRLQRFEGDCVPFELSREETAALKRLALEQNATLYMVLLALYNILLSKISGQEDIIVGSPTAGRKHADLEYIIGMFVNTLALRNFPRGDKSFLEFLARVKERTLKAFENQEYQFEELVDKLALSRDTSRNPLFDTMFSLQNIEVNSAEMPEVNIPELALKPYKYRRETSKFDLTLSGAEGGDNLRFAFTYCSKLFKRETVERFIRYFKKITGDILEDPGKKISDFEIISGSEKEEKIREYTRDLRENPGPGTIQKKLKHSFQKYSDLTAVEYGDVRLSYRELESKAAFISNWIIDNNIEKGSFIGIHTRDKAEMIVIMVGILNAGCVVVPMDSTLHVRRIEDMVRLTNTGVIFTDAANEKSLTGIRDDSGQTFEAVVVDRAFYPEGEKWKPGESETRYSGDDRVYIYFTSGSTGTPQAIMGRNESLTQFIQWEIDTFNVDSSSRVSQLTAVAFDAFLRDVFTPLCAGGTVCIPGSPDVVTDRDELVKWLDENNIGMIHCVPSLFRVFNTGELTADRFRSLKYILLSGEEIKPLELKSWYETFGERIQLVNLFGPTETTMVKTCYFIRKTDVDRNKIPIGKPMRGSGIILLDKEGNICTRGVIGEIYLRTPYRTFGYYNNAGLTGERFVPNPFNNDAVDLIYKTGDLGRELVDGDFEFVGRHDRQVKVRGIRVELGEIETVLLQHDEIREAVVLTRADETGDIRLCVYLVAGSELSASQLRDYLSHYLPGYMIPSYFVQVDRMPLTPSGKVDRKRLPAPEPGTAGGEYVPPGNKTEETLAAIWSGVLAIDREGISINADFFELGGHSLKAIVMTSRIHKELNVKVPLSEVFKAPSISALARYIHSTAPDIYTPVEAVEKREYYECSSAQKRLYFLQQLDPGGTGYNMPAAIPLEEDPDIEKFNRAFGKLIRRHESLRTSFLMIDDRPVQKIHDEVEFEIEHLNPGTARSVEVHINAFVRPFDLSMAPLLRIGLIKTGEKRYILMVDMHHTISDAVSHAVLENDFITLLQGKELPPLQIQYKDFSQWQNKEKGRQSMKRQESYWLKEFNEKTPTLNLPTDFDRPETQDFAGGSISFEVGKEETDVLKTISREESATMFVVMLTFYYILLFKLSGQEEIVVGTPVAGRGHADLQQVIGVFVNAVALKNQPKGEKTFTGFLKEVKQKTLDALENQDYQFEDLVEKLPTERTNGRNPLFDAVFSLQNVDGIPKPTPAEPSALEEGQTYRLEKRTSKFDLILSVVVGENLNFSFEYSSALFKKKTVEDFVLHFKEILSAVLADKDIKLDEIKLTHQLLSQEPAKPEITFGF